MYPDKGCVGEVLGAVPPAGTTRMTHVVGAAFRVTLFGVGDPKGRPYSRHCAILLIFSVSLLSTKINALACFFGGKFYIILWSLSLYPTYDRIDDTCE